MSFTAAPGYKVESRVRLGKQVARVGIERSACLGTETMSSELFLCPNVRVERIDRRQHTLPYVVSENSTSGYICIQ